MTSVIVVVAESGQDEALNRRRSENYLFTMGQWIDQETDLDYEVITVEQDTGIKKRMFESAASILAEISKVQFTYTVIFDKLFRRGWALNAGARLAKGGRLIFADADALVGLDFMETFENWSGSMRNKSGICWSKFYRLTETGRRKCLAGVAQSGQRLSPEALNQDDILHKDEAPTPGGAAGGINYFDRDFFFNEVGGWNETFSLGAGGDNDMVHRAVAIEGSLDYMAYDMFHLYHHGKVPGADSQDLWKFTWEHPAIVTEEIKRIGIARSRPTTYGLAELAQRHGIGGRS